MLMVIFILHMKERVLKMYKIIAIIGKCGSGKSTLAKNICKQFNAHDVVRSTTRPRRDNEVDGVDYKFTTLDEMAKNILQYLDIQIFDTIDAKWAYGTNIQQLNDEKINVVVLNYDAIEQIIENVGLNILFVFVDARDDIRLMRSIKREQNPNCSEICRRFLADSKINEDEYKDTIEEYDFNYINIDTTNKAPYDCAKEVWSKALKYFK